MGMWIAFWHGAVSRCSLPSAVPSPPQFPPLLAVPPSSPRSMPNLNGMHSAASALRYYERKQEVVATNLANVSTNGFKAQRVFATLLDGIAPAAETGTDFNVGSLRQTGNATDVAIDG